MQRNGLSRMNSCFGNIDAIGSTMIITIGTMQLLTEPVNSIFINAGHFAVSSRLAYSTMKTSVFSITPYLEKVFLTMRLFPTRNVVQFHPLIPDNFFFKPVYRLCMSVLTSPLRKR